MVAVWPSVDRQALGRAFSTVKSQALRFESCAIGVSEAGASARCQGTLEFVPKVGRSEPRREEQEWLFTMRKAGTEWKINGVAAAKAPR